MGKFPIWQLAADKNKLGYFGCKRLNSEEVNADKTVLAKQMFQLKSATTDTILFSIYATQVNYEHHIDFSALCKFY